MKTFKRKIYPKLLEWKNSPVHNSALLIEGARRVGKSTIVEEFAKNEYEDYILVDFRQESNDVKKLFENTKNLDEFYRLFFLSQNHVLKKGGLIILDEIQFCPKAREAIKDFVKDGRYDFIETGSLISIKENTENIMIPSEERRIEMYPMDFEEFLWAYNIDDAYPLLKESIHNGTKISEELHTQYLRKYRTYMIVGGMPKVLSIFLETNSFELAEEEKNDILKLYRDDLRKHDNKNKTICSILFDSIGSQLAKDNKRFVIKTGTGKKRYEQIEQSLKDLQDFKIVNIVKSVNTLEKPMSLNVEDDKFKLYFCDTGLLISQLIKTSKSKINKVYFDFINGKKLMNAGAIYESIVVQEAISQNYSIYYHRYSVINKVEKKEKKYELDVVLEKDFNVFAIEVKSSKTYTTSSLDHINKKYPQLKIGKLVIGVKNIKLLQDKKEIPIYLFELFANY